MRIFSSKRPVAVLGMGLFVGLAASAVVHAAVTFGPTRPTYTWAQPADHITFNSITDNPVWGDERYLLKSRDINSATTAYSTSTQVTDNEEVVLAVYFHNNAASNLNLTATNTSVRFSLPSGSGTTLTPTAYITASNANPNEVWSTADLTSSQPFTISYEPGTAKLYTNYVNGIPVSDNVVNGGTLVGSGGTDGKVPGCSQYSGYVTIRVRVHVPSTPQPVYSCDLLHVESQGNRTYKYSVDATAKNGATITGYNFNFGDSNSVNTTSDNTTHTYAKDGTYTTTATVKFNVGTSEKTASCSQTIKVSTSKTVTPVVSAAKTLPNTGPGDVLGIFTGASAAGGVGHFIVSRRRKN